MEDCFVHENVWSMIIPLLGPLERAVMASVCSFFGTCNAHGKRKVRIAKLMVEREYWQLLYYYIPECSNPEDLCYYFIQNDLDGKMKLLQKIMPSVKSLCTRAAANGHEKVIKLFHDLHKNSDLRYDYHKIMVEEVKNHGSDCVIAWIKSFDQSANHELADIAARHGQLELLGTLQWLGFQIYSSVAEEAAKAGNLRATQFCVKHFCRNGKDVDIAATQGGHVHILEWIITIRPQLSEQCATIAARNGDLQTLQWLYTHGCKLSESTFIAAMESGSIETAQWCLENACPWSKSRDYVLCSCVIKPETMQWYKNYTAQWLG